MEYWLPIYGPHLGVSFVLAAILRGTAARFNVLRTTEGLVYVEKHPAYKVFMMLYSIAAAYFVARLLDGLIFFLDSMNPLLGFLLFLSIAAYTSTVLNEKRHSAERKSYILGILFGAIVGALTLMGGAFTKPMPPIWPLR